MPCVGPKCALRFRLTVDPSLSFSRSLLSLLPKNPGMFLSAPMNVPCFLNPRSTNGDCCYAFRSRKKISFFSAVSREKLFATELILAFVSNNVVFLYLSFLPHSPPPLPAVSPSLETGVAHASIGAKNLTWPVPPGLNFKGKKCCPK